MLLRFNHRPSGQIKRYICGGRPVTFSGGITLRRGEKGLLSLGKKRSCDADNLISFYHPKCNHGSAILSAKSIDR